MKHFLLISLLAVISIHVLGQRAPGKIRKAFEQQYPAAENVKWSNDGERIKEWTVTYDVGSDSLLARYDSKANWIITLTYMSLEDIPAAVIEGVKQEYQGCKLLGGARLEEPDFDGFGVAFMYKKDRWGVQVTKEGEVVRRKLSASGFDF